MSGSCQSEKEKSCTSSEIKKNTETIVWHGHIKWEWKEVGVNPCGTYLHVK